MNNNTYIMLSTSNFLEDRMCYDKVKEYIKPNSSIVCIPFACDIDYQFKECDGALSYDGSFWKEHYNHFKEYGISKSKFYVTTPSDNIEFIKWKIEKCDILYLSGGSMKNLKFMLQALDLWDVIKKLNNKIFVAESAGVLMMQEYYTMMNEIPMNYEGLNLLDNMNMFVHYNKEEHEYLFHEFKKFLGYTLKHIYAISDEGGLIIRGNDVEKIGEVYR